MSQPQPSVPMTVGVSYIDGHSGGGGQVHGVVLAVKGVVTVVITVVVPVVETVVNRVVAGGVSVVGFAVVVPVNGGGVVVNRVVPMIGVVAGIVVPV